MTAMTSMMMIASTATITPAIRPVLEDPPVCEPVSILGSGVISVSVGPVEGFTSVVGCGADLALEKKVLVLLVVRSSLAVDLGLLSVDDIVSLSMVGGKSMSVVRGKSMSVKSISVVGGKSVSMVDGKTVSAVGG